MFAFEWPLLIVLLVVPLFIRFLMPAKKALSSRGSPEIAFPHLSSLRTAFAGVTSAKIEARKTSLPWLLYAVWSLSVVALMRPQIIDQIASVKSEGRDLMLAVDLSGSMQSLDFSVNGERSSRLDVAKKVVKDFVMKRVGDRVGLIVFGEHAYLQSPLTLDRRAVTQMLDNNLPGMAGDSTAIGDAIGLAVKNLRSRPAQSKALILLTDGDDNASTLPPIQAAQLANQYGIRIYTVVIGKEGLVPFPDERGGLVMVESHVDTTLTREIARLTGGDFYRATDPTALAQIYNRIDSLQKSETDLPMTVIRKPLFQYPLGAALLLFALFWVVTYTKGELYEPITV
jgi:Ca-activated chloride channel family protein